MQKQQEKGEQRGEIVLQFSCCFRCCFSPAVFHVLQFRKSSDGSGPSPTRHSPIDPANAC